MLYSPSRSPKTARKRPVRPRFIPRVEQLEDRTLFDVALAPGPNVNISRLHDNQAEATIAVDPTDPQYLFAASMTFHGSLSGTFDPNSNVNPFTGYTDGIYVA